ncbi:hypothetical protein VTI74DRAFT_7761 [Chaetomium olivicolor]
MYGDHTPFAAPDPATLTPLGANQLYNQGSSFRDRYVRPKRHDDFVGIVGISPKTIDNSQLHVESSTEECSSASALAFVQGLYPQFPHVHCDFEVPEAYRYPNDTIENYPLSGYQYPNLRTVSKHDPDSIWSHGHHQCTKHEKSLLGFANNSVAESIHHATKAFYSRVWSKLLRNTLPGAEANFYNAYDMYDQAAYLWHHRKETHNKDKGITAGDMAKLRQLAWQEQVLRHANIPEKGDAQDDLTSAVAGRTLAARVSSLFAENIESYGQRNKLNLAFTSHEPFLGFFALAGLATGPSSHLFRQLPGPGTTLTFELFSIEADDVGSFSHPPDSHNRFLNTNGRRHTDSCEGNTFNCCSDPITCHPNDNPHHDHAADGNTNEGALCSHELKIAGRDDKTAEVHDEGTIEFFDDETADSYNEHSPGGHDEQVTDPHNHNSGSRDTSGSYNGKHSRYVNTYPYPSIDQLRVRFLYRDSCRKDSCEPFMPYPLFGSNELSMPFKHFQETVGRIGIANATKWCTVCESDAFFCHGAEPRR